MTASTRIDQLLQYALARAGQEEDRANRELGAIHLVKHVYLADLAYADRHRGETFTGAPWQFYHFGPWAPAVHDRIAPVVAAVGAQEQRYQSARTDAEAVRYLVDDDALLQRLEAQLPVEVTGAIARAVRRYGSDTPGLLATVYLTRPMLRAAPGEYLDFAVDEDESAPAGRMPATAAAPSPRAVRDQRAALRALRERVRRRLAERTATVGRPAPPDPPPRYDQVFLDGLRWLDSLAGDPIESGQGTVTVGDDVWKSRGRRDPGIP